MKITLVRHGQTEENFCNRVQGKKNNLLNDTGRRQCNNLRMRLLDKKFDYCYMSPLVRCVETAFILVGDRVEMIRDDRLIEREMGELEGRPREEYNAYRYWDYDLNTSDRGVEPIQDVFKRCEDFLDYIKNKYPNSIITSSVMYPKLNYQGIDDKVGECSLYNELITKFDKVIIRPEFAKTHLLETIDKISDISKIQVPINDSCKMNCQHFKECFNITSSNFVCPKDIDEKFFGIKSKFTNLCIIEKDLINNFTKSKINNFILSSYNVPIAFLETIFNEYMFNTDGDFQKYSQIIRYDLNDLISKNIFHSEFQKSFFSMNFSHKVNLLEI